MVIYYFILQFQLGSAKLKKRTDSAEFITRLFNHCISSMKELGEQIQLLETDNERLSQERINALKVKDNLNRLTLYSIGYFKIMT